MEADDDHETSSHKLFLTMTKDKLREARMNLRNRSELLAAAVSEEQTIFLRTLKDLESIREEYEDGILLLVAPLGLPTESKSWDANSAALEHFFTGLEQHVSLLNRLFAHVEATCRNANANCAPVKDLGASARSRRRSPLPRKVANAIIKPPSKVHQRKDEVYSFGVEKSLKTETSDQLPSEDALNGFGLSDVAGLNGEVAEAASTGLNGEADNDVDNKDALDQLKERFLDCLMQFSQEPKTEELSYSEDDDLCKEDDIIRDDDIDDPLPSAMSEEEEEEEELDAKSGPDEPKSRVNKLRCDVCREDFSTVNYLKLHQRSERHKMIENSLQTPKKENDLEDSSASVDKDNAAHASPGQVEWPKNAEGLYECSLCSEAFITFTLFRTHQAGDKHKLLKAEQKKQRYRCEYCPRKFATSSNLKTHIRTHTGERPFICEVCSLSFASRSNLVRHQNIHNGIKSDKVFNCDACDKSFSQLINLKEHKTVHTGEVLYVCTFCGKGFRFSSVYHKHMQSRHNLKPSTRRKRVALPKKDPETVSKKTKEYKCNECGKVLKHGYLYNTHMRRHQGILPFKCKFCQKPFLTKGQMKIHERIHNGDYRYECDRCGKRFYTRGNLKRHLITHVEDKTFQCDICQKSFAAQEYLDTHKITHNDTKFPCDICNKSFNTRPPMYKHRKTHFKNELEDL